MVTAEVCDVLQWAPHMDPTYQLFGVEEDMEYLRLELIESAPEKN